MSNSVYKITKDEDTIKYQRGFYEDLVKKGIPTIYLGDIEEKNRFRYFSNNIVDFDKEHYFNMELGTDIIDNLAKRYNSLELKNKDWTEGNGVLFLYYKNIVIVMDYEQIKDDKLICVSK